MKTLTVLEIGKLNNFKKYGTGTNATLYNDVCTILEIENTTFGRKNIKDLVLYNTKFSKDFTRTLELVEKELIKEEAKEILKSVKEEKIILSEKYSILNKAQKAKEIVKTKYMSAEDRETTEEFADRIKEINTGIKTINEAIKEEKAKRRAEIKAEYSWIC